MKSTRGDVAKLAGVSTATVSYVINKSRHISVETRDKVYKAIDELQYKPDMIARSMVKKETMQLGIVLESNINPSFGEIVFGFENAAIDQGYFVNICTGSKYIDEYLESCISRRIDGIFVSSVPVDFHIDKLYKLVDEGIKVVVGYSCEVDIRKVSIIENDPLRELEDAVAYLYGLGHRNIAYISDLRRNNRFRKSCEGYLKAMEKVGLDTGENLLIHGSAPCTNYIRVGYQLTKELLGAGKKFTAIICVNDLMAMGAIKLLTEKGIKVPADVSVMGFGDHPLAAVWEPSITTMCISKVCFGAKAFELLYTNIKNGNTGFFTCRSHLIERESTGFL